MKIDIIGNEGKMGGRDRGGGGREAAQGTGAGSLENGLRNGE